MGQRTVADMEGLKRTILAAVDDAGSYRALARRSNNTPSPSTLNNIVLGRHSGVFDADTVRGLARCLEVPLRKVEVMTGTRFGDPRPPFTLPDRANLLTSQQRRVVLSVVDAILTAGAATAAEPSRPVEDERPGLRSVARKRPTR